VTTPHDILGAVQAIHDAPPRLVYVFAGAGSLALHWLHSVAGSSRTVLEARDCYAPRSLGEIVQGVPRQAASPGVAHAMARWAVERAARLAEGDWPLLGVACTAAIATDRERRGADRACVAVSDGRTAHGFTLTMAKGLRSREQEEELASRLVILAIARACGVAEPGLDLIAGEALLED
jgi:hypothetical protein